MHAFSEKNGVILRQFLKLLYSAFYEERREKAGRHHNDTWKEIFENTNHAIKFDVKQ